MDVSGPYRVLGISKDIEVLVELTRVHTPRSGRQIAATLEMSHVTVTRALNRFAEQGLALREIHPPAHLYTLNREHLAAPIAEAMAGMQAALLDRLRDRIGGWAICAVHASLFGSAARGTGGVTSDLDILIVRSDTVDADDEDWRAQLDRLAVDAERWTGNRVQMLEFPQAELEGDLEDRHPTLVNVQEDAISLHGGRLSAIARSVRHG